MLNPGPPEYVQELSKERETGNGYSQGEADFDMQAAETAWPNFKTFFE